MSIRKMQEKKEGKAFNTGHLNSADMLSMLGKIEGREMKVSFLLWIDMDDCASVVLYILAKAIRSVFVLKQLINVVLSSVLFIRRAGTRN